MPTPTKIETYLEIIEEILEHNKESRDDDNELYERVLWWLLEDPTLLSVSEMFNRTRTGLLPNFDTVTRLRRMVQKRNLMTRGARWNERHKKALDVEDQQRERQAAIMGID